MSETNYSVFYVEETLACSENKENKNADNLVRDHQVITRYWIWKGQRNRENN